MEKVEAFIAQYHMIEKGDKIVTGVSGGADSMCLLFLLMQLRQKIPFSIHVVHINHKIRKEAQQDAAYVERICREHNLPFTLAEEDVEALSKQKGLSCEEAGRMVRYQAFYKACEEYGANKIAVAHNKNDCGETFLFHLFRGSDLKGLSGIAPVRGQIIRPLLCLERKEIEAYLKERGITYCEDFTNRENRYTRNRIRNDILPYISEHISGNIVERLYETAKTIEETETFLQKLAKEAYEQVVKEEERGVLIQRDDFLKLDRVLQRYIIMNCFFYVANSRKDLTALHVQKVLSLFQKPVNKRISLPYGMTAFTTYQEVVIEKKKEFSENTEPKEELLIPVEIGKPMEIKSMEIEGLGTIETRVFLNEKCGAIPEKTYTKWFDYDKIGECLLLRHRRVGDYFTMNDCNNKKTIKDYMIQEKIPVKMRDKLFMLCVKNHVVWLIGYRISRFYKVNQNTKHILEVHITGGNEDVGTH